MERRSTLPSTFVLLCGLAGGARASAVASVLYVSNSSALGGTGSLDDPFTSLQDCVDALVGTAAGSSCLLLEGTYSVNQTVVVQSLHGTLDAPYLIGAASPGANVLIDGTLAVPGPWSLQSTSHTFTDGTVENGAHWVAEWPDDGRPEPWQLFVDGEMMIPARWPNARWDDRTVFDDTYWAHGSSSSTYCGSELRDTQYAGPCRIVDGTTGPTPAGSRTLAASGINATGAAAVLNIGHCECHADPRLTSFLIASHLGIRLTGQHARSLNRSGRVHLRRNGARACARLRQLHL